MAPRSARRRGVGARLENALIAAGAAHGCAPTVAQADSAAWASATFLGARHRITLAMDATPSAYALLTALPELELPIRGHLVADMQTTGVRSSAGQLHAVLEVLTVEEC